MSSIKDSLRQAFENMQRALTTAMQQLLPLYDTSRKQAKDLADKIPHDSGMSWWEYWERASHGIPEDDYCALYRALKKEYDNLKTQMDILKYLLDAESNPPNEKVEEYNAVKELVYHLFRLLKLLEALCNLKKSKKQFGDLLDSYGDF